MRKRSMNEDRIIEILNDESDFEDLYYYLAKKNTEMLHRNRNNISVHHRYAASPYHIKSSPLSRDFIYRLFSRVSHCQFCAKRYICSSLGGMLKAYSNHIKNEYVYAKSFIDVSNEIYDVKKIDRIPNMLYSLSWDNSALINGLDGFVSLSFGLFSRVNYHSGTPGKHLDAVIVKSMRNYYNSCNGLNRKEKYASESIICDKRYRKEIPNAQSELRLYRFIYEAMMKSANDFICSNGELYGEYFRFPQMAISGCMCKSCFMEMASFLCAERKFCNLKMGSIKRRTEKENGDGNGNKENNIIKDRYSFLGTSLRETGNIERIFQERVFSVYDSMISILNPELNHNVSIEYSEDGFPKSYEHLAPYTIRYYMRDYFMADSPKERIYAYLKIRRMFCSFVRPFIGKDGFLFEESGFEERVDEDIRKKNLRGITKGINSILYRK